MPAPALRLRSKRAYMLVGLIVGLSSFGLLNVVKSSPAAPSLRPAMNTSAATVTVNGDSDQQRVTVRLLKVSDPAVTRSTDYEPDAGHRWIAVRFGLTNTGSVSSRLNLADATELLDAAGNFYPSIVDARTNAGPRLADELLLRPGATASGVLVYEVPQSFRPSLVTLSLGDRSDQQTQWAL